MILNHLPTPSLPLTIEIIISVNDANDGRSLKGLLIISTMLTRGTLGIRRDWWCTVSMQHRIALVYEGYQIQNGCLMIFLFFQLFPISCRGVQIMHTDYAPLLEH